MEYAHKTYYIMEKTFTKYCTICSGLKTKEMGCYFHSEFIPREGQEKAFEAISQFIENILEHKKTSGLLLVGGVGSGKTFLTACLVNTLAVHLETYFDEFNYIVSNTPYYEDSFDRLKSNYEWLLYENKSICFIVLTELFQYLRQCYGNDNKTYDMNRVVEHIKQVDILVLDDMGVEKSSDWTKEILFNIIDYRYNENLPLVVTTNCVPDELKEKIEDRNFDRLREMCALVPVTSKSQRKTATI